jgi:leucyl aminopeptidase
VLGCRAPARAAGMIRIFISMVKHTGRLRAPAARILPDLSVAGLQRHGRTPDARAIDSLDALILVAPPAESELWAALPEPGRWRALAARSKPAALKWHATDLANARQTHAVLGYAKPEASAFERLSFAGKLIGEIAGRRPARVGLLVSESLPDAAQWYEALLSAAWSASFALPHFRSEPGEPWRLASLQLYAAPALATERMAATARAGNLVRTLTALPPNRLDAAAYLGLLRALARRHRLELRWYPESALRRLGAGAFLAVSRANAARDAGIAHLRWRAPGSRRQGPEVALVGKGILFDTGGINLKGHRSMLDMHIDMSGSAVALASLVALAELRAPIAADAWLAITENNTGPSAYRPQEVVRACNGTTIQVIHSDAEGRMVLADTLALAARTRPGLMLDFATLTGACVTALTERYSGVFTNRPAIAASLLAAGRDSGERVWNFPLDEDFDSDIESSIADVAQCAVESRGDHILAARFLQRFVADRPWAHLDLASAMRRGGLAHVTTDITGFGVRWTLELLLAHQLHRRLAA